jgi:hypothetical protein
VFGKENVLHVGWITESLIFIVLSQAFLFFIIFFSDEINNKNVVLRHGNKRFL